MNNLLKFRLQVRDQDDLRHDGVVEGNIAFAFHEVVVEEKVKGVEPTQKARLGDFVDTH